MTRVKARVESSASSRVDTIAIIGAGTMGRQVSWACAVNGLSVRIYDANTASRRDAENALRGWLEQDLDQEAAAAANERVLFTSTLEGALTDIDLAFENVPEDLKLKRRVHAEIDAIAPQDVLQGSNASALTCLSIASATNREDRFFNMNFTFPRAGNRLVEVMPNPNTSTETMDAAMQWARQIGMIPIALRREILGYVQNRIWRAIKKECLFLVDKGYATPEDIDRGFVLAMGVETGPFALMDQVGLSTVKKIEDAYFNESGNPSDRPPDLLIELIAQGLDGIRTGRGFYQYPNPSYQREGWLEGDTDHEKNSSSKGPVSK